MNIWKLVIGIFIVIGVVLQIGKTPQVFEQNQDEAYRTGRIVGLVLMSLLAFWLIKTAFPKEDFSDPRHRSRFDGRFESDDDDRMGPGRFNRPRTRDIDERPRPRQRDREDYSPDDDERQRG